MKFAVNWDYRCPFARNAHEHIAVGLADGADWQVTFLPFSLNQVHVAEGDPPVWDNPDKAKDLMALASGVVVRDQYPDRFLDAHIALFTARHDDGRDLRLPEVVADILDGVGVPGDKVIAEVQSGTPLQEIGKVHQQSVSEWRAFGVPTFVVDGRAAFVRLMSRPDGDPVLARRNIDGVLQLFDSLPDLNEYKFTTLER
jgi:hypothetical protein